MRRVHTMVIPVVIAMFVSSPNVALARIKLITLPIRERVEIQLDHPDVTLVEEERIVPLVQGLNQVDFSWAHTQIEPETIIFRILEDGGENRIDAEVLSVSYPPNEQALVWQVGVSASGSARVRISYLLGGLTKNFHYRAVASRDEQTLTLMQYIRLRNFANESFESSNLWAGYGNRFLKPVGMNETKQMLAQKYSQVKITKTYTCDPKEFGYLDRPKNKLRVPMHYVLTNTPDHNLGQGPLPAGKVRIFQDDGRGSVAFIGEDWGKFTPIDDQMRLYLGVAQDIVVKRTIDRNLKQPRTGQLHNREVVVKYEIENFKDIPVTLDLVEDLHHLRGELGGATDRDIEWVLGPETTFEHGFDREKTTHRRVLFRTQLPPKANEGAAKKIVHKLHLIIKNEW